MLNFRLIITNERAKCWFFGVSVVRIWPKKVGLDEPMTLILAKTSKRCQSTQNPLKSKLVSDQPFNDASIEARPVERCVGCIFLFTTDSDKAVPRKVIVLYRYFLTAEVLEKKAVARQWGSVRYRWHYWSRVIVCCVFHYTKIFFYQSNETIFTSRISAAF